MKDVVPEAVSAGTTTTVTIEQWTWKYFTFTLSQPAATLTFRFGKASNQGHPVFYFNRDSLPTFQQYSVIRDYFSNTDVNLNTPPFGT